jgi:hypothetical protein
VRSIRLGAGHSNAHLVAETEGSIVVSIGFDRTDREIGPLRELVGYQLPYQRVVEMNRMVRCVSGHERCASLLFHGYREMAVVVIWPPKCR